MPGDLFCNIDRMRSIECPVTVLHGTRDEVVPFHHGEVGGYIGLGGRSFKPNRRRNCTLPCNNVGDLNPCGLMELATTTWSFRSVKVVYLLFICVNLSNSVPKFPKHDDKAYNTVVGSDRLGHSCRLSPSHCIKTLLLGKGIWTPWMIGAEFIRLCAQVSPTR